MSTQVCCWLKPGSVLLLVARSETLLQELKEELKGFAVEQQLLVNCIVADLSTQKGVNEAVRVARLESEKENDHVLLINNAGEHSIAVFVEICPTYSRFCIQISNVSLCFQPLWVTSPSFQVSLTWMW